MALVWDKLEERWYETGVDHGVLYTPDEDGEYTDGVPWNGLVNVNQTPSGAEATPQYADNIKYINQISAEEFGATIEAYTFPREFLKHDGIGKSANGMQVAQQNRPPFGFSWRNLKGNAVNPDAGYILNLAYGLQASPSERSHGTVSESPELATFSWALTSTPVPVTGFRPTAIIRIDSTDPDITPAGLAALENVLYAGGALTVASLPLPDEVETLLGTV